MRGNMDRFKVGDKVYNKKGSTGEELGTVAEINGEKIIVRQFSNNLKEEYDPNEIYNQQEHKGLLADWLAQMPKNDQDRWNF